MSDPEQRAQRAGEVARAMAEEQDRRNAEAVRTRAREAELQEVEAVARKAGVSREIALMVITAVDAHRAEENS